MAWIESHTELATHPKLVELCFCLGIKKHEAIGHLHLLWYFTLNYAWENGDLRRFTARTICEAAGWDKDPDTFINSLRSCGWLEKDSLQIHDWMSYAGKLVNDRLYNKKRRKTALNGVSLRKTSATVPYRNSTDKDIKTKESCGIQIPEDLKDSTPEIQDWLEYKKQRGQTYKPKGLEALWRSFRAIPPEKRREAVDHSMSNNWSGLFEKKSFNPSPTPPLPREVIG